MNEFQNTQQQKKFKVLLIGDSCVDEYQYGTVDRISPEAPVPIFNYLYSEERPGMVLNVKENLQKHGMEVTCFSSDLSRKIRVVDLRTKQHLLRIDKDVVVKEPLFFDSKIPNSYDGIVVSDYDKGYITYEVLEELSNLFSGPIYVDTKKKDLKRLKGCIVKINEQEKNQCISLPSELIVTLGSRGAVYKDKEYVSEKVEVSDVCGAGDTFLAALVCWHLYTGNIKQAIIMANKAAAVTVQHFGTYAPSLEEYV